MGCWNGTCGISQLPISSGDKVRCFLILQSEFNAEIQGSGACYSSNYFRPWFFPVKAEYNDYGSIENIEEDWNSKYVFDTFRKLLANGDLKLLGDESEVNDPGIDKFDTIDDIFDCIERGGLVFNSKHPVYVEDKKDWEKRDSWLKIGLFMVLEPVYQAMAKESERFCNLPENNYWKENGDKYRTKFVDSIKKERDVFGKELSAEEKLLRSVLSDMDGGYYLGDIIEEHYAFKHYKSFISDPNSISIDTFTQTLDEVRNIATAMTYLRKMWIPQCGQGSQSDELSFNKALISGMNDYINQREKELEKWRKEEEEWNKKWEAEQATKKAAKKVKNQAKNGKKGKKK